MTLQERIRAAVAGTGGACVFNNNYRVRGMANKKCIGFEGDHSDCMQVIGVVIGTITKELFDAATNAANAGDKETSAAIIDKVQLYIDALLNFKTYTLGWDTVFYYPNLEPIPDVGSCSTVKDCFLHCLINKKD